MRQLFPGITAWYQSRLETELGACSRTWGKEKKTVSVGGQVDSVVHCLEALPQSSVLGSLFSSKWGRDEVREKEDKDCVLFHYSVDQMTPSED